MRDYKHVKVPRGYRATNRRIVTKRVNTVSGPAKRRANAAGRLGTALALLLTAALGYGGWEAYQWFTHAELFQVAGVDVKGVRSVSEGEIRELAGMFTGQNIFGVDLGGASRRALANPRVRDVRIERSLPNRISILITERTPRAVLQASNGRFLIDGEGVVMATVQQAGGEAAGLPVIAVRDCRAVLREAASAGAVSEALELARELAARGGWDPGAVTVKADSAESIAVVYADHEFRIGSGNYDEKLRRMGEIVADMRQRGQAYSYVELRPERQAAVMVANNTKAESRKARR
jgi:cell division protein FtsQ